MVDNRTNEPTPEQVEAAAKAIADCHNPGMFDRYPENWRVEARAALVAAQGAAPQAESADCDRDRMGICKRCGMGWDARKVLDGDFACPVQPSSAVLEAAAADAPQAPKDIHEPNHERVYCVRCGGNWPCQAPQAESVPKSSYISPSLPGMIRNLWKSDPSENSVRTALKLAGDLIQELIDLKAAPVLPSSGVDEDKLAEVIEARVRCSLRACGRGGHTVGV